MARTSRRASRVQRLVHPRRADQGEPLRLFRIYAEGNFIEAGLDTPFLQTGEAKYGKPIIDRVITPATSLTDATKCVLVSFDSTMRSNLSVGMPIDLICYERDSLEVTMRRRFDQGDPYFTALSKEWSEGTRARVPATARAAMVEAPGRPIWLIACWSPASTAATACPRAIAAVPRARAGSWRRTADTISARCSMARDAGGSVRGRRSWPPPSRVWSST